MSSFVPFIFCLWLEKQIDADAENDNEEKPQERGIPGKGKGAGRSPKKGSKALLKGSPQKGCVYIRL